MSRFPNYKIITTDDGKTIKVSPLRIGDADSHVTFAAIADFWEGDVPSLMRRMDSVYASIRAAIRENHSEAETEKITKNIRYSAEKGTVFVNCLLALIGTDPATVDVTPDEA